MIGSFDGCCARAAKAREPNSAIIAMRDSFLITHRAKIILFASRYRLPVVYPYRLFVEGGGLLSYGVDQTENFRRAATYVDRILKGTSPSELPVQSPVKFQLVINLRTAKAFGLTIPEAVMQRADEIID
jgi:putative ABC transport system substrate-binding protein